MNLPLPSHKPCEILLKTSAVKSFPVPFFFVCLDLTIWLLTSIQEGEERQDQEGR